jgi:hypothetical protein
MKHHFPAGLSAFLLLLLHSASSYASAPIGRIPEPGAWSLLGIGAAAAVVIARFKKNK